MSDERYKVWKNIMIAILDNTIPEKKKETSELLSSYMEEIMAEFQLIINEIQKITKNKNPP